MGSESAAQSATQFWVLAGVLLLAAILVLFVPIWRRRRGDGSQRAAFDAGLGLALAVLLPLIALPLYFVNSQWGADASAQRNAAASPPQMSAVVAELEARVRAEPADGDAWWSLARVYLQQGDHARALVAFEQAAGRLGSMNPDVLVDWAEAMLLAGPERFASQAADKLDTALTAAPRNVKALWLRGQLAFAVGDFPLAVSRWEGMVALARADPSPQAQEAIAVVERAIEAARRHMGEPPSAAATQADPGATSDSAGVEVRIALGEMLREQVSQLDATTPLFVLARTPNQAGPPLAVQRRTLGELPLVVRLSDGDAMLPGRTISSVDSVEIVARISLGGQPTARAGDLFGARVYNSTEDNLVEIVIDQVLNQ